MKRKRIVLGPRPTEAGADRAKQTVSVHGLAGSSFELEVSSGETGWDVAKTHRSPSWPHCRGTRADLWWLCRRSTPTAAASSAAQRHHVRGAEAWRRSCSAELVSPIRGEDSV